MAVVSVDNRHRRKYVSFLPTSAQKSESAHTMAPHHLRVSTGSCHDFYKNGRENSVETNTRKPFLPGIWKPFPYPLSPIQMLVSVGKKEGVASVGKKKGDVVSDGRKKEEAVSDDRNKKEEVASDGRKREGVVDRGTQTDPKDLSSSHTKSCLAKSKASLGKKKTTILKPATYTKNHSPDVPSSHNKPSFRKLQHSSTTKTHPSNKSVSSGNKTLLPKRELSSAKKSPEIAKSASFKHNKVADSVKQVSRTVKKTAAVVKDNSVPVQLKPIKVKPPSSSSYDLGTRGKGRTNSNGETGRKLMTPKASAKRTLPPPPPIPRSKLSLNKKPQIKSSRPENLKMASSVRDQSRTRRVSKVEKVVSDKTLHVMSMNNGNKGSEYISGDNPISSPTSQSSAKTSAHRRNSSSFLSCEEDMSASVEEINNKTMRKARILGANDKHASPMKVKFQSDNNNKGDLRRETSKRGGQSSQMKHQNVQGKKDGKGLMNNVIEETSSKLGVSRKSRVKALVGAFETVISLQEENN